MPGGSLCNAMVLQPDGKFILGGAWGGSLTLIRYLPDGSSDGTFGTVQTSFFPDGAIIHAMALQTDGKILAAGEVGDGGPRISFVTTRYLNDLATPTPTPIPHPHRAQARQRCSSAIQVTQ